MNNEKITFIYFHRNPTDGNSLKFELSISGDQSTGGGEVNFWNSKKIPKIANGGGREEDA